MSVAPAVASPVTAGKLVELANQSRTDAGKSVLSVNSPLETAAKNKAQDMLEKDYFAHTSPDGRQPWDFITAAGYQYSYAGENLAIGYLEAEELHDAWMNSPSHRENILHDQYTDIGIAVLEGEYQGSQTIVAVQMFGRPLGIATQGNTNPPSPQNTEQKVNKPTITKADTEAPVIDYGSVVVEPRQVNPGEKFRFEINVTGDPKTVLAKIGDDVFKLTKVEGDRYGADLRVFRAGPVHIRIEAKDAAGNVSSTDVDLASVSTAASLGRPINAPNKILVAGATFVTPGELRITLIVLIVILAVLLLARIPRTRMVFRHAFSVLLGLF